MYHLENGSQQLETWLRDASQKFEASRSTQDILDRLSQSDTKLYHRPPPKDFMRSDSVKRSPGCGLEKGSMSLTGDQFHLINVTPDQGSQAMKSECMVSSKSQVVFSGFMMKRGFLNTGYKKRWFVVKDNHLLYFKQFNTDTSDPRGIIKLTGCRILEANEEVERGFPYSFMISTPVDRKLWVFDTFSHREKSLWIEALHKASLVRNLF